MAFLTAIRRFRRGLPLLVAGVGACFSEPPPQKAAETTATPDQDMTIAPAPQAPASKIGTLPLVRPAPSQGTCRSTGTDLEPRYAYDGDEFPARSITVGEGGATRGFVPNFIEIRARQTASGGVDEHETVYVLFSPDGRIETGTRQYFNTASPPVRETGALLPGDTAALRDLALFVLQKCKQPTPPTTPTL